MTLHALEPQADQPNDDNPEQLVLLEGWVTIGRAFSLKSANRIWTDQNLAHQQRVTGTFTGRVKGLKTWEEPDGAIRTIWDIEVLDANLDGGAA